VQAVPLPKFVEWESRFKVEDSQIFNRLLQNCRKQTQQRYGALRVIRDRTGLSWSVRSTPDSAPRADVPVR